MGTKNKTAAGLLALFLGGIGVHKFYLKQTLAGVLHLLFCWTGIPGIIAFVEAIIFLTMSDAEFNAKYNIASSKSTQPAQANISSPSARQYILVEMQSPTEADKQSVAVKNIAEILIEYKKLLDENIIAQEEFDAIKQKTLSARLHKNTLTDTVQQDKCEAQLSDTVKSTDSVNTDLQNLLQKLQECKLLLDNDVLSEAEFNNEKAKIMEEHGFAPQKDNRPSKLCANNVDGNYDYSTMILSLSNNSFSFVGKETKAICAKGTFVYDKNNNVLMLLKADNTMIKLFVDDNGDLISPGGVKCPKIK